MGFDLILRAAAYGVLHPKLVKSCVMDALLQKKSGRRTRLMFDVSAIVGAICRPKLKELTFEPTNVQLSDLAVSTEKAVDVAPVFFNFSSPQFPAHTTITYMRPPQK